MQPAKEDFLHFKKTTAAIHQLTYGTPADQLDEYTRMGECTAIECLSQFCWCVIDIYGAQYLRRPNTNDVEHLLQLHSERHGFSGMLGSIDCMHWQWKNCPVAWKGQFTRSDQGSPTIMLEAIAAADLWIWHAFFGIAGSNNDINYNKGYCLADGIYPEWTTFVKSFTSPKDPKRIKFKQIQEAASKDVEQDFGVVQSRWAIVCGPARFWHKAKLKDIVYTCIILHNMIVEDEGDAIKNWDDDDEEPTIPVTQVENFHHYL
ncbi:uncharacterized protein [Coffea arabica]|uniref:Protein ALP1-like n=1 Tax=Coffea arabica TaxID=13443 RepID=A0A6P6TFQ0_COFAR|nr:uncharacterized protein LOC113700595 [Coffea arabica]